MGISITEKQLIGIIRYSPFIFILLLFVGIYSYITSSHKKNSYKQQQAIEKNYITQNKTAIKANITTVNTYIEKEFNSSNDKLKLNIKKQVNNADQIASTIYEKYKDIKSKEEITDIIKNALRSYRFNEGRGYFFIYDLDGTNILHPTKPNREGLNFYNARDSKNVPIVQESINIAKSENAEGFQSWMFNKPNNQTIEFKKIGFIKKFKPYNWYIGTGEYIVDFENKVKKTILQYLSNIEYKNKAHIFVIDNDGKMLLTKTKATHINEIYKGDVFAKNFMDFVSSKKENTYIKFKFKSNEKEYSKVSYLRKVDNLDWIIGTGFNLDELNIIIQNNRIQIEKNHTEQLSVIRNILLMITLLLLVLSYFISKYIEKSFSKYRMDLLDKNTELKDSEKSLNLIIDKSPVGICTVDLLGNFVSTNPTYEKMLGYSKKELRKFSFFDITHPDYRPKNKDLFQKMFSLEESGFDIEKVYICKDSKEIDVRVHAVGINDKTGNRKYGIAFVEDITEKKHAHELLVQKKQELERIIQDAPNPMMLYNEDGKVLMINQAWSDSSGYLLEEVPTIDAWLEHIYDNTETQVAVKKYIVSLYELTEKSSDGDFTFLNKDRKEITWQFSSAPLGLIDSKRTIIASAMDITELKQKDEMLINQSRHAAMGEMIGMIAHQWRQPLSTISMDANNMLMDIKLGALDISASEEYARSIAQHTQHLSSTIDDFRNFFKPDKVISKVNIKEILDQTLSIVNNSLKNHNITLVSSFETEKQVEAYPRELMQVLVNIITNAKDALVQNKREKAQINIRVFEDEKYINTEICDNGGGIDAQTLPKVFDPYFSTKSEKNGTGLGLYMSKMIIEDHLSGKIEVSNKNEGACFTIRLLI